MKVAIQFYSVKEALAKDAIGTMEEVARIGYRNWEICQLFGKDDMPYNYGLQLPPAEGKALVDRLGVKIVGCHLSDYQLTDEKYLTDCLDYMQAVDCWSPGLAAGFFTYNDRENVKRLAELYNHVGRECAKRGMVFHYHNHFHEFQRFGDDCVLDLIMEYTDPELVKLEIDTYWAMRGGADPIEYIEKYSGRVIMLHQKDFPKDTDRPMNLLETFPADHEYDDGLWADIADDDAFAEVGTGVIDIQRIIDAGNEAGVRYITLEQDKTKKTELESIRISMESFRKYTGLEWD